MAEQEGMLLGGGMLRTRVAERGLDVTTAFCAPQRHDSGARGAWRPWTAISASTAPYVRWMHAYDGPTTPGGLAEAHNAVVARVKAGELPPPPGAGDG